MPRRDAAARTAAALLVLALGAGCASQRIAMTHTLRQQLGFGEADLKNLQYYLSDDVVLQRSYRSEEGVVSKSHALVLKEGGLVEEVLIRRDTPGIATQVGATSLAVSFEPGASLVFGSPESDADPERRYKLSAARWSGGIGELSYDGKAFQVVEGGRACLVVDAQALDAVEKKRKVLPGMKLPEGK